MISFLSEGENRLRPYDEFCIAHDYARTKPFRLDAVPKTDTEKYSGGFGAVIFGLVATEKGWIAVGEPGLIAFSPDGMSWNKVLTRGINDMAWDGQRYVCIDEDGGILSLTNGMHWSSVFGISDALYAITWSGQEFIAVGRNAIVTSPDAETWTTNKLSSEWPELSAVASSGSRSVAVGRKIATTSTLHNWMVQILNPGSMEGFSGVLWDGEKFVAVGGYQYQYDRFAYKGGVFSATSPDGFDWKTKRGPADFVSPMRGTGYRAIAWNGELYVAVGRLGEIATSLDGLNWNNVPSTGTSQTLHDVVWGRGYFVAVGESGAILSSEDGLNWKSRPSAPFGRNLNAVIWDGARFVAAGSDGMILSSTPVLPVVRLSAMKTADNHFELQFAKEPGLVYQVEASADLRSWTVLTQMLAEPVEIQKRFVDTNSSSLTERFYRVRVVP